MSRGATGFHRKTHLTGLGKPKYIYTRTNYNRGIFPTCPAARERRWCPEKRRRSLSGAVPLLFSARGGVKMRTRSLFPISAPVAALVLFYGMCSLPATSVWAGICDMPPEYTMFPPGCCQVDSDCDIPGVWPGTCAPAAIGFCRGFFWDWFNGIYLDVCASDAQCPGGSDAWCVPQGQCYNSAGQPTGQKCIVGADPSIYGCVVGGYTQWGYLICDANHPCDDCCAMGHCSSWSGAFCNEGEQCLPCTCVDNDGDGYGNPASPACAHPELDCDDTNPDVHPGAIEECGGPTCSDGLDNDCNGLADSKDPACKQWCPRQVQGSTVDSNRTVSRAPVALFAALVLPPCAILVWKGLRRRR
jgi:hypothetical protein